MTCLALLTVRRHSSASTFIISCSTLSVCLTILLSLYTSLSKAIDHRRLSFRPSSSRPSVSFPGGRKRDREKREEGSERFE